MKKIDQLVYDVLGQKALDEILPEQEATEWLQTALRAVLGGLRQVGQGAVGSWAEVLSLLEALHLDADMACIPVDASSSANGSLTGKVVSASSQGIAVVGEVGEIRFNYDPVADQVHLVARSVPSTTTIALVCSGEKESIGYQAEIRLDRASLSTLDPSDWTVKLNPPSSDV